MEEKKYTIKDIERAWDASERYREQLNRIISGHSNYSVPFHHNKQEYLNSLESE